MNINLALTQVLPILNIVLSIVLVGVFIRMFMREFHTKIFVLPWKLLFVALLIFVVEEILTILRHSGLINFIHEGNYLVYNGFLEMGMATLLFYMLLIQKEHVVEKGYHKK